METNVAGRIPEISLFTTAFMPEFSDLKKTGRGKIQRKLLASGWGNYFEHSKNATGRGWCSKRRCVRVACPHRPVHEDLVHSRNEDKRKLSDCWRGSTQGAAALFPV